jgi:hypothetical protein
LYLSINFDFTAMKNILYILGLVFTTSIVQAQMIGGYNVYGYLATATHPQNCSTGYVTHLPDDSIWVNFAANDSMAGTFTIPSHDGPGEDLVLESGFNLSSYTVRLLLSNGQYSMAHTVFTTDWVQQPNTVNWKYLFTSCGTGTQTDVQFLTALDYNLDFNLTATDTVTGLKIIFIAPGGDVDFAGAYIVSPQEVGINNINSKPTAGIFPVPFSEQLNVTMNNLQPSELILYDVTSRKMVDEIFIDQYTFNTSRLVNGIYFYEIWNDGALIKSGKILKK